MDEPAREDDPFAAEDGAERDIGALLRQAFDPAQGAYPPHFSELGMAPGEWEFAISRQEWPAVEERLLRRCFASLGRDYHAWRRARRWQQLRQWGQYLLLFLALVALALGAGAAVGWWGPGPSPGATPGPRYYVTVTAIPPDFAVPLPPVAPVGYRLADVVLAGVRSVLRRLVSNVGERFTASSMRLVRDGRGAAVWGSNSTLRTQGRRGAQRQARALKLALAGVGHRPQPSLDVLVRREVHSANALVDRSSK